MISQCTFPPMTQKISAGGLMNGKIRLFNAVNGNHIAYLQTPEVEIDR